MSCSLPMLPGGFQLQMQVFSTIRSSCVVLFITYKNVLAGHLLYTEDKTGIIGKMAGCTQTKVLLSETCLAVEHTGLHLCRCCFMYQSLTLKHSFSSRLPCSSGWHLKLIKHGFWEVRLYSQREPRNHRGMSGLSVMCWCFFLGFIVLVLGKNLCVCSQAFPELLRITRDASERICTSRALSRPLEACYTAKWTPQSSSWPGFLCDTCPVTQRQLTDKAEGHPQEAGEWWPCSELEMCSTPALNVASCRGLAFTFPFHSAASEMEAEHCWWERAKDGQWNYIKHIYQRWRRDEGESGQGKKRKRVGGISKPFKSR